MKFYLWLLLVGTLILGVFVGWLARRYYEIQTKETDTAYHGYVLPPEGRKDTDVDKYIRITLNQSGDPELCDGFKFEFIDPVFRDNLAMHYLFVHLEVPQLDYSTLLDVARGVRSATVTFPAPERLKGLWW